MKPLKQILLLKASREYALLLLVVSVVFIVPFFNVRFHLVLYRSLFAFIYFLAAFSVMMNRRFMLSFAITVFALDLISGIIGTKIHD